MADAVVTLALSKNFAACNSFSLNPTQQSESKTQYEPNGINLYPQERCWLERNKRHFSHLGIFYNHPKKLSNGNKYQEKPKFFAAVIALLSLWMSNNG